MIPLPPVALSGAFLALARDVGGPGLVERVDLLPVATLDVAHFQVVAAFVFVDAGHIEIVIEFQRVKINARSTGPEAVFIPRIRVGSSIMLALHSFNCSLERGNSLIPVFASI